MRTLSESLIFLLLMISRYFFMSPSFLNSSPSFFSISAEKQNKKTDKTIISLLCNWKKKASVNISKISKSAAWQTNRLGVGGGTMHCITQWICLLIILVLSCKYAHIANFNDMRLSRWLLIRPFTSGPVISWSSNSNQNNNRGKQSHSARCASLRCKLSSWGLSAVSDPHTARDYLCRWRIKHKKKKTLDVIGQKSIGVLKIGSVISHIKIIFADHWFQSNCTIPPNNLQNGQILCKLAQ